MIEIPWRGISQDLELIKGIAAERKFLKIDYLDLYSFIWWDITYFKPQVVV